jgi:fructose-1,6-bisphosphatase I
MGCNEPSAKPLLPTLRQHLSGLRPSRDAADWTEAIEAIALAGKVIAGRIRRARLEDVLGEIGQVNVQGEVQQKLDVLSNRILLAALSDCPSVGVCTSEEEDQAILVRSRAQGGRLVVSFDPLDGSSNIDVAVGVGTIFGILEIPEGIEDATEAALQPGIRQLAAGYILYGSSVLLVLAHAEGVDLFVLDPDLGEFLRVQRGLRIPDAKKIYSLNEAYSDEFPEGYQRYLAFAHRGGYAARYIGSMVADVHRTLIKGGVFLYPPTAKDPHGKLRALYEVNPLSFVIERAGGAASTGTERALEQRITALHQRCPIVIGSRTEVENVLKHL